MRKKMVDAGEMFVVRKSEQRARETRRGRECAE